MKIENRPPVTILTEPARTGKPGTKPRPSQSSRTGLDHCRALGGKSGQGQGGEMENKKQGEVNLSVTDWKDSLMTQ